MLVLNPKQSQSLFLSQSSNFPTNGKRGRVENIALGRVINDHCTFGIRRKVFKFKFLTSSVVVLDCNRVLLLWETA